jgi:hypothetical protein
MVPVSEPKTYPSSLQLSALLACLLCVIVGSCLKIEDCHWFLCGGWRVAAGTRPASVPCPSLTSGRAAAEALRTAHPMANSSDAAQKVRDFLKLTASCSTAARSNCSTAARRFRAQNDTRKTVQICAMQRVLVRSVGCCCWADWLFRCDWQRLPLHKTLVGSAACAAIAGSAQMLCGGIVLDGISTRLQGGFTIGQALWGIRGKNNSVGDVVARYAHACTPQALHTKHSSTHSRTATIISTANAAACGAVVSRARPHGLAAGATRSDPPKVREGARSGLSTP